jgi:hypothetical protein
VAMFCGCANWAKRLCCAASGAKATKSDDRRLWRAASGPHEKAVLQRE